MTLTDPDREDDLPEELAGRLAAELGPGERVAWSGRSHLRVRRFEHKLFLGLGLIGLGIVIFCQITFGNDFGGVAVAMLFGVVICWSAGLIVTLSGLGGIFVARRNARHNRQSLYAITDRRAIVWRPAPFTDGVEVRSYSIGQIVSTSRIDHLDGTGDIRFHLADGHEPGVMVPDAFSGPVLIGGGFFGICDPRRVEEILRKTLVGRSS